MSITTRWTVAFFILSFALAGCPESKTPDGDSGGVPQPITTETRAVTPTSQPSSQPAVPPDRAAPVIAGGWTVSVTSAPPGINPDMFDTPEKKAKMFFDHHAQAADGKVTVEHKTLATTVDVDPKAAAELDAHMNGVDWGAVMASAQQDGKTEGGTTFKFSITVGQASWEITTTNIEKHPDLMKVVDALKAATGKP